MLVTITNVSTDLVYFHISMSPGQSITTRRTTADLERDHRLSELVASGLVTLAFTKEFGDDATMGLDSPLPSYSNATRPAATTIPARTAIWNTDDSAENFSDGTNWRDNAGNLT